MEKEKIGYLIKIYNTLLLIDTKGENTLLMADVIRALGNFINQEKGEE